MCTLVPRRLRQPGGNRREVGRGGAALLCVKTLCHLCCSSVSCPPEAFVAPAFLGKLKAALRPGGLTR